MKIRSIARVVLWMMMLGALAAVVGCDDGAEGEGEGEGEAFPDDTGPTCSEARTVDCEDEVFTSLTMNLDTAAPGLITNEPDGDGFVTNIDGTAGGFNGDGGWVYGKFTATGLQKVELIDIDSFGSLDWDIAFRRFVVRVNSGYGGPSCVTAARTGVDTRYDSLAHVPAGLGFSDEQFMSDPDTCTLIKDGSGLDGTPGVVLQNWWEYPGCVATTGNVYVLSLADGRRLKLVITDYYDSDQDQCNDGSGAGTGGANFKARFAFFE